MQNARRPREAADLLALLSSKDWAERLSPESAATTMFRQSQMKRPRVWTDAALTLESSESYAEVVSHTQSQPTHMCALRIPGWQRYLAVLDEAVLSARSGQKNADRSADRGGGGLVGDHRAAGSGAAAGSLYAQLGSGTLGRWMEAPRPLGGSHTTLLGSCRNPSPPLECCTLPNRRLPAWGGSSAGRARRSQCRGRGFDPLPLHLT